MLVHLDTDFAGDPDDACALVMLLGSPEAELTGITTALEDGGRRAGCVRHVLSLAGRTDIPVARGAEKTLTGGRYESTWSDRRHWPEAVAVDHSPPGAALDLLASSIERGATIIAVGGFTNLAMLELARPGALQGVHVVAMSGWFAPAPSGWPPWGPDMDFNTQADTRAAEIVAQAAALTLVPLPIAMGAWLRRSHLARLRAAGVLGQLLADQSEAHGEDSRFADLAAAHDALPADLVNFHWDPLTCAVALGWPGATIVPRRLRTGSPDRVFTFVEDATGQPHQCVAAIDGDGFSDYWLAAIERAGRVAPS